jgi:hypothetical protein
MDPLFEAKALFDDQYALYNIYRIEPEKYKAERVIDEEENTDSSAPMELIVSKNNGKWETDDKSLIDLGATLGIEIDAFNYGYGALLGRIGNT